MHEVRAILTHKGEAIADIASTAPDVADTLTHTLSRFSLNSSIFDPADHPGWAWRTLHAIGASEVKDADMSADDGWHLRLEAATEYTLMQASDVRPGYTVKLPDARRFERIEAVSTDDLERVVFANSWGTCPLQPTELVAVEALTGLTAPDCLRAPAIEAEIRALAPPGNAACKGTIAGVPVRRHAVHIDVAGTPAYDVPSAVALVMASSNATPLMEQARERGEDAARSAATWTLHAGATPEDAAALLALLDAGDPAASALLPERPSLTGELGDNTPATLFEGIIGRPPVLDSLSVESEDGALIDALASAYEEGVTDAFGPACEAQLAKIAPSTDPAAMATADGLGPSRAAQLAKMVKGYTECALWSSTADETPLDANYGVEDMAPATIAKYTSDCVRFLAMNAPDLDHFTRLTGRDFASHGHDFWLTRNNHGAGFWDRYMEAGPVDRGTAEFLGKALTHAVRDNFPETDLYPGDDGRLYLT